MTDATKKVWEEKVQKCANELAEHADSVRIFVTKYDDEEGTNTTASYNYGCGNLFSQLGQVREWIVRQDEYVKEDARKRAQSDDE